jgi:hypothetical protein
MKLNSATKSLLAAAALMSLMGCRERVDAGRSPDTATADREMTITDEDVRDYELTLDGLQRWHRLQVRSGLEPALAVPQPASDTAPPGIGGRSATYMMRVFTQTPEVNRAIQDGGLTVREFVLIGFALVNAAAALDAEGSSTEIPPTANSKNTAFVSEHAVEINRMHREQVDARREGAERSQPPRD